MKLSFALAAISACCVLAMPAYAYVGPGPGLSMVGSLFTLIGGIFIALFMVVLYPIRLLYKRVRGRKSTEKDNA